MGDCFQRRAVSMAKISLSGQLDIPDLLTYQLASHISIMLTVNVPQFQRDQTSTPQSEQVSNLNVDLFVFN